MLTHLRTYRSIAALLALSLLVGAAGPLVQQACAMAGKVMAEKPASRACCCGAEAASQGESCDEPAKPHDRAGHPVTEAPCCVVAPETSSASTPVVPAPSSAALHAALAAPFTGEAPLPASPRASLLPPEADTAFPYGVSPHLLLSVFLI